ncbi:MAG: hypothetical protein ACOX52_13580 [Verrucomicrobiota bacterium]
MIPIHLTKAVVENGFDVGPFSPLPIHLCDRCGIPPHPDPKTFSDGLLLRIFALLCLVGSFIFTPISRVYPADEFPELEIFKEMEAKRRAVFDDVKIYYHRQSGEPGETYKILVEDSLFWPRYRESEFEELEGEYWILGSRVMGRIIGSDYVKGLEGADVIRDTYHAITPENRFVGRDTAGLFMVTGKTLQIPELQDTDWDEVTREETFLDEDPCAKYRFYKKMEDPKIQFRQYDIFVNEGSEFLPIRLDYYTHGFLALSIIPSYQSTADEIAMPIGWTTQAFGPSDQLWNLDRVIVDHIDFNSQLKISDFDDDALNRAAFYGAKKRGWIRKGDVKYLAILSLAIGGALLLLVIGRHRRKSA